MQIIARHSREVKLRRYHGYVNGGFGHKHRFRMSYIPQFHYVGFLCRECDEIVLVERDLWHDMIHLGQDWRKMWRTNA